MHLPSLKLMLSRVKHLSLHVSPGGSVDEQIPFGVIHRLIGGGQRPWHWPDATAPQQKMN